jgi:hypothetical protein
MVDREELRRLAEHGNQTGHGVLLRDRELLDLLDDLAAANARLAQVDAKGGIADLFGERDQWRKVAERLEAENAALRERIAGLEERLAMYPSMG